MNSSEIALVLADKNRILHKQNNRLRQQVEEVRKIINEWMHCGKDCTGDMDFLIDISSVVNTDD